MIKEALALYMDRIEYKKESVSIKKKQHRQMN